MKKITVIFVVFLLYGLSISQGIMAQAPDWTRLLQLNSNSAPTVNQVTADANNVYMACKISGSVTFDGIEYTSIGLNNMLLVKMSNTGVTEWVTHLNAQLGGSIYPNAIKVDGSGNIYVAATFFGTVNIGGETITSDQSNNSFFVMFDSSGKSVWATPFLSTGTGASKIAVDENGNSFLLSKTSKLLKFNNLVILQWEQNFTDRTLQAIAVQGSDLFIGGALQQGVTTFGAFNLLSSNAYNTGFLAKADLNGVYNKALVEKALVLSTKEGNYQAVGTFNHPTAGTRGINVTKTLTGIEENVLLTSIGDLGIVQLFLTINYDNTVTVTGSVSDTQPIFQSGVNFYDPVSQKFTLNYSYEGMGGTRIISEVLTKSGNTFGGDGSAISDIAFDLNGNMIITGAFTSSLSLGTISVINPKSYYTFIAKCNTNFDFDWIKPSSSFTNSNRDMYNYRVFVDNSNNIYEFGMISSSITFGSVPLTLTTGDQFLFKFNPDGNAINGYALQNASYERSFVSQSGKVLIGGNINLEGSTTYGNFYFTQFNNYLTQDWQKISSKIQSGNAAIRYIKHDAAGNTYLQSRVIGYCDYFGTIINTNRYLTVISKHDSAGKLLWMNEIADLDLNLEGAHLILDKNNNVLTVGLFQTSLNIGNTTLTSTNSGNEAYVAKYSSGGEFLWAAKMNLNVDVSKNISVAVDNAENVLVSGVLNPSNYLVKFDASGNQLWAKSFPMESYYTSLVSTDTNNNIYLASEIHLSDFSGSTTIGSIPLTQTYDDGSTVLIKFDPNGNALWAKTYGGVPGANYSDGWPCDIKTDASGNTYLWGWCVNNAIFGYTALTNPYATNQNFSYYLTKINTSGDVLWANAVYETKYAFNYGDLLDLDKNGNVYIGGHFRDIISIEGNEFMPEGTNDFFAVKYSGSGVFQWIKTIPANNDIIKAFSIKDNDILSVAGYAGINSTLGSFNITRMSGSNCMVATLGNLTTGTREMHNSNISVFPNPVSTTLFISGLTQNSTVSIFDVSSKLLINKPVIANQIDISKLANGFYTLRIVDKNGIVTKNIVKQ